MAQKYQVREKSLKEPSGRCTSQWPETGGTLPGMSCHQGEGAEGEERTLKARTCLLPRLKGLGTGHSHTPGGLGPGKGCMVSCGGVSRQASHSPENKPAVSSCSTRQGSFPGSSKESKSGLEMRHPTCGKDMGFCHALGSLKVRTSSLALR